MKNLFHVLIFSLTPFGLQCIETRDSALLRDVEHIIIARLSDLQSSWKNLNISREARLKLNNLIHTLRARGGEEFRNTQALIDYVAFELQDLRRMQLSPDSTVARRVQDAIMDFYDDLVEQDYDDLAEGDLD